MKIENLQIFSEPQVPPQKNLKTTVHLKTRRSKKCSLSFKIHHFYIKKIDLIIKEDWLLLSFRIIHIMSQSNHIKQFLLYLVYLGSFKHNFFQIFA
jgi:hypothetical protein